MATSKKAGVSVHIQGDVDGGNTGVRGVSTEMAEASNPILRLQGPENAQGVVPHITHFNYHVHGKSFDVPVNGDLEVTEAQYKVITGKALPEGYSWLEGDDKLKPSSRGTKTQNAVREAPEHSVDTGTAEQPQEPKSEQAQPQPQPQPTV